LETSDRTIVVSVHRIVLLNRLNNAASQLLYGRHEWLKHSLSARKSQLVATRTANDGKMGQQLLWLCPGKE